MRCITASLSGVRDIGVAFEYTTKGSITWHSPHPDTATRQKPAFTKAKSYAPASNAQTDKSVAWSQIGMGYAYLFELQSKIDATLPV